MPSHFTRIGCHLTFTWFPSHTGVCGNELADVVAKERTTVEQEGESHHYDSRIGAISLSHGRHTGVCGNELAHVVAKERTTVEQEGESHHYDSAKAVIQQATEKPPITHERVRQKRCGGEPQVGMLAVVKEGPSLHQQTVERPTIAPQDRQSAQYYLSEMWYGEETVEHAMGEWSRTLHPANQLPDPYLIATNPFKASKLWELWKA